KSGPLKRKHPKDETVTSPKGSKKPPTQKQPEVASSKPPQSSATESVKTPPRTRPETVSLIDEAVRKSKRLEGEEKQKRSVLPPIWRLRVASEEEKSADKPAKPASESTPVVPPPTAPAPTPDGADAAPATEEKKVIHIKPPIVVKDLALQLGMKNFQ